MITVENMKIGKDIAGLFEHLTKSDYIVPLEGCDRSLMRFHSRQILRELARGDGPWKEGVPELVHQQIVEKRLFGYDSEQTGVLVN